jgi:hypothetical protein
MNSSVASTRIATSEARSAEDGRAAKSWAAASTTPTIVAIVAHLTFLTSALRNESRATASSRSGSDATPQVWGNQDRLYNSCTGSTRGPHGEVLWKGANHSQVPRWA